MYSNCSITSFKHQVFNEMEMKINVINNEIFTKLHLKIRVRGKEISYHFLVKGKPHERIDLLITKIQIVMKTCFS